MRDPRTAVGRAKYEYEIPVAEAEEKLRSIRQGPIVEKTRFLVPPAGLTWEVGVRVGILAGVVLAEVELDYAGQELGLPDWVGREVAGDPAYRERAMMARAAEEVDKRSVDGASPFAGSGRRRSPTSLPDDPEASRL